MDMGTPQALFVSIPNFVLGILIVVFHRRLARLASKLVPLWNDRVVATFPIVVLVLGLFQILLSGTLLLSAVNGGYSR